MLFPKWPVLRAASNIAFTMPDAAAQRQTAIALVLTSSSQSMWHSWPLIMRLPSTFLLANNFKMSCLVMIWLSLSSTLKSSNGFWWTISFRSLIRELKFWKVVLPLSNALPARRKLPMCSLEVIGAWLFSISLRMLANVCTAGWGFLQHSLSAWNAISLVNVSTDKAAKMILTRVADWPGYVSPAPEGICCEYRIASK